MKAILQLASGLDWLTDHILEVCKYATMVVVGLIAGIIFIGVFWRYVLNDPLAWYEETAKYLMLWLVFVASPHSAQAHRARGHRQPSENDAGAH